MCTVVQIDTKNFNTSFTQSIGALCEDSSNVYIFWLGRDPAVSLSAFHHGELWVRPLSKSSLTLGTAFRVDTDQTVGAVDPAWDWDGVGVIRLTSGVMIAAYGTAGTAPTIHAKESAANDHLTWGGRATVDSSGANRCFGGIGTDGTNCWAISQDQNTYDLYLWTRTAANTWAAAATALGSGKIHDAAGSNVSPFYDVVPAYRLSSMRCIAMESALVGCIVLAYSSAANVEDTIRCLWTVNGWASTNEITIKSYVGSPDAIDIGAMPKLFYDRATGRIRLMWSEVSATKGIVPVFAYSDNVGQTWTVIGTPAPLVTHAFDNTYDGAFCVGPTGTLFFSMFDTSDASNIKHRMFTGGDSLLNWVETQCQHLSVNIAGAGGADAFISDSGEFIRIFNADVGPGVYHVDYLIDAVPTTTGGEPELVLPAPSGADAANVYLRLRLAEKRGWSVHDLWLTQMFHWPEGDITTERQLDRLIGLAGSIDPSVTDPANIACLYVIDNEEHYGLEVREMDDSGNTVDRLDEFSFEVETACVPIAGDFDQGILRGFQVWYRAIAPLRVEVIVDDRVVQVTMLPPSGADMTFGLPNDRFIAVFTDENNGTHARLRITDRSLNPVHVEGISIVRIEKGRRG